MTRRNRPHTASSGNKPIEKKDLTDFEKLQIKDFLGQQDQVIAAAQAAAQTFVKLLMSQGGMSVEEGWMLNRDRMRWERRPVPAED